jgi:hypothetical protein
MERTRHIAKDEHQVWVIGEETRGKDLRAFARKNKIPLLKRKMRRTKFPNKTVKKTERKLHLISRSLKENPGMKRTKFNHNED